MTSAADRQALLAFARHAIAAAVGAPVTGPAPTLDDAGHGGAFVSLHERDGDLRGCIGFIESDEPRPRTVHDAAVAAATRDPRFPAVRPEELPGLRLEISLLTPPHPIRADEVECGRHGLIVSRGSRRGLLLPQVPAQFGWTREQFLAATCRKAGLPETAWRDPDTQLEAFEAEVFAEPGAGSATPESS
ncbi:MAG: AmmeMemoRadiSam system protein A [Vicinamibacteria bacterium]|nr:AmmeMemoRadiSam system protein A [Vicinamibacteria bacterium]